MGASIERAISRTFSNAQGAGGITIKVPNGEEPKTGYVVATSTKWTVTVDNAKQKTRAELKTEIKAYVKKYRSRLNQDGLYLGLWYNKKDGKLYLDISEVLQDKEAARKLGASRDQIAIWDIFNKIEIPTGGSGKKG